MKTYLIHEGDTNSISIKKLFVADDVETSFVEDVIERNKEFLGINAEEEFFIEELNKETWRGLIGPYSQGYGKDATDGLDLYHEFLRNCNPQFHMKQVEIDGKTYVPIETYEGEWDEAQDLFWAYYSDSDLIESSSFEEAVETYIKKRYEKSESTYVSTELIARGCYHVTVKFFLEGDEFEDNMYIFNSFLSKMVSCNTPIYEMEWQESR